MTKSLVRFSLIAMLLVAITGMAFAYCGSSYQPAAAVAVTVKAATPTLVADGPSPVPWPPKGSSTLVADGPSPVPWPPVVLADAIPVRSRPTSPK